MVIGPLLLVAPEEALHHSVVPAVPFAAHAALNSVLLMWVSTLVDFSCGKGIVRDEAAGRTCKRFVLLS